MGDEDDLPGDEPDAESEAAHLHARRAVVFEEVMRGATSLMAVIFGVSVLTATPVVPDWIFAAALAGVLISVPTTISVRVRHLRHHEPRSYAQLWNSTLLAAAAGGLVLALLPVIARVVELGTALLRWGAVLAVLCLIARLRGWQWSPSASVDEHARDH